MAISIKFYILFSFFLLPGQSWEKVLDQEIHSLSITQLDLTETVDRLMEVISQEKLNAPKVIILGAQTPKINYLLSGPKKLRCVCEDIARLSGKSIQFDKNQGVIIFGEKNH